MTSENPFPLSDHDRHELWDMLVARDVEAFVAGDWQRVAEDFIPETFIGIDGKGSPDRAEWDLRYPTVASYRQRWEASSRELLGNAEQQALRAALYEASSLRRIDVNGDAAVVHKQLKGALPTRGKPTTIDWTTLYFCRRTEDRWRIQGFLGYLPTTQGSHSPATPELKQLPPAAMQHQTAGPYSPVLIVRPQALVVISGQAAIDPRGNVVGDTIEEQTTLTLENCRRQLETAGCTLGDVFKTNAYLAEIADWQRFNSVYERLIPAPRPVRTTVGARLLPGLLVEIEMWAVRR
jgi:enamine deaminase RidA (YjgF/YER057c/UK114 family)